MGPPIEGNCCVAAERVNIRSRGCTSGASGATPRL